MIILILFVSWLLLAVILVWAYKNFVAYENQMDEIHDGDPSIGYLEPGDLQGDEVDFQYSEQPFVAGLHTNY